MYASLLRDTDGLTNAEHKFTLLPDPEVLIRYMLETLRYKCTMQNTISSQNTLDWLILTFSSSLVISMPSSMWENESSHIRC